MSWALRDEASIDTTISSRRLTSPNAATNQLLTRIGNLQQSGEPFRSRLTCSILTTHPAKTGENPWDAARRQYPDWTSTGSAAPVTSPENSWLVPYRPDSAGSGPRCVIA